MGERDWVSVCEGGGGTTSVVCSCWWVRVGLLGSNGNPEETSFEDFLLECAQHQCHWKLITRVEVLCFCCNFNRSSFLH